MGRYHLSNTHLWAGSKLRRVVNVQHAISEHSLREILMADDLEHCNRALKRVEKTTRA